jgi:hypothetical protein
MSTQLLPIDKYFADKRLLGKSLDPRTRLTWSTVWKAAYALPLTKAERAIFNQIAGGREPPTERVRELWVNAGRRSGKSEQAAACAIHSALFVKHKLSRGERGMVLVIAGSRDQAGVVFGFIKGLLEATPTLRREVVNSTQSEVTLKNGIVIAVHSNSFRTIRGRTLVAAIFDEVSFWRDESSATPDREVYRAVLPALSTTKGILIGISSPYRRVGLLYQKFRDCYGEDGDILIIKGATRIFNPTIDDAEIARQRAADPESSTSEWDAEFRDDLATFLADHLIDAAIDHGRPLELSPQPIGYYKAFCDTSGGAVGGDCYTVCVGHKENGLFIIDVVRGVVGPFDPYQVTKQYAELLKQYRIGTVTGDRYGKEWVQAAWRGSGVAYVQSPLAKSDIYLECVPLFSRGLVRLPDHSKLLRELRLLHLQRHTGGRESVDHPKGEHDDYANVVCGVLRGLSHHLGYDTLYRAFDPAFRDEDLPPLPTPERKPLTANDHWWEGVESAQPTSSADQKLNNYYQTVADAVPWWGKNDIPWWRRR